MSTGKVINIPSGETFTNVYTASGIALGTKLLIQNLSSSELFVSLYATAQNQGFVVKPYDYYIVPSGSLGCFVRNTSEYGGYISVEMGAWNAIGAPIDERVYTGLKGLTVQSFVEANSKNGTQFELSYNNNAVPAGGNFDFVLRTGSKPVLIKSRQISFTGTGVEVRVYKDSVNTDGTSVPIYNLNTDLLLGTLVQAVTAPTITSTGTEIGARNITYGVADTLNKPIGTFTVGGNERVLKTNTNYLLRVTNLDTSPCKVSTYITYYEGEISSLN